MATRRPILCLAACPLALLLSGCANIMSALMLPSGATAELNHFAYVAPQIGATVPNIELADTAGETVSLDDLSAGRPVVLVFASYTCPVFRQRWSLLDDLTEEFGERVQFALVYTIESHPMDDDCVYTGERWDTVFNKIEGIRVPQPRSFAQRVDVARRMQADMDVDIPVFVDAMDNRTWRAFGAAPTPAFLLDERRTVKLRQVWFEPSGMRRALRELATGTPPESVRGLRADTAQASDEHAARVVGL